MTQAAAEWLESQYDMRARIPDRAEIFARWARDSAQVRALSPAHLDLAYGPDPTERQQPARLRVSGPEWHLRPDQVLV